MDGLDAAIRLSDVGFEYQAGNAVLDIAEFEVVRGERVFLEGRSGSGKSTLLGLVGGILCASSGSVTVLGQSMAELTTAGRDRFRADYVGFIFQMFNLLPYLSVVDNVLLPCRFSARRAAEALARSDSLAGAAERILSRLGLGQGLGSAGEEILQRAVTELSIGQQQRVAVARALIGGPAIVIADEPASALDLDTRDRFVKLLIDECAVTQSTVLFVSHDPTLAPLFDRAVSMSEVNRASMESERGS